MPVLCVAKVEACHILRAFEGGAEGVFIAECGEMCAREKTAYWLQQQTEKVRRVLDQLGMGAERLQVFDPSAMDETPVDALNRFTREISGMYLEKILSQEVKK